MRFRLLIFYLGLNENIATKIYNAQVIEGIEEFMNEFFIRFWF
jgi:hypothetical protein